MVRLEREAKALAALNHPYRALVAWPARRECLLKLFSPSPCSRERLGVNCSDRTQPEVAAEEYANEEKVWKSTGLPFAVAAGIFTCTALMAADARESQIISQERAFDSAWNKRDPEAMADLITSDFVIVKRGFSTLIVTRGFSTLNRTECLDGLKAGHFTVNDRESGPLPKDFLIRFYGPGTAVVTFSAESLFGPANGKQVLTLHRFTHVWVNPEGKGWQMASRHVSLPPALHQ